MPYKYSGRVIREGKSWKDNDGIAHPANWATAWDAEEKASKGITFEAPVEPHDNRFYWGRNEDGTLIPRALEDVLEVDEQGNPVLDEDGNQVVTRGLKSVAIEKVKGQAKGLLEPTDWWVLRAFEDPGKPIDTGVKAARSAIRSKSNEIEAMITACVTLEDFIALHESTEVAPAPISDWPK